MDEITTKEKVRQSEQMEVKKNLLRERFDGKRIGSRQNHCTQYIMKHFHYNRKKVKPNEKQKEHRTRKYIYIKKYSSQKISRDAMKKRQK